MCVCEAVPRYSVTAYVFAYDAVVAEQRVYMLQYYQLIVVSIIAIS
jgi:hypothetical protein